LADAAFDGALQHCAVGKDRTGVGCALTLFALGCDTPTVMEEYLLTHGMLNQVETGISACSAMN
jgi:protein tyrosine/serine phosphatase